MLLRVLLSWLVLSPLAFAQPAAVPPTPAEMQEWVQTLAEWDRNAPDLRREAEVVTRVHPQMMQAGTAAAPVASDVASLLAATNSHWHLLADILLAIAPPAAPEEVPQLVQQTASADGATRVMALARLGSSTAPSAFTTLRNGVWSYRDQAYRITAITALGRAGHVLPPSAAGTLAAKLGDGDRSVRVTATRGLERMCSSLRSRLPPAVAGGVASSARGYLQTREDIQGAVAILSCLPREAAQAARPELQAIVDDPKLREFLKINARRLLLELE